MRINGEHQTEAHRLAPGRILLVDDDEEFVLMLERMLVGEGYEILRAVNGTEALHLLRKNPADLIITDLVMPEKNGLELLQDLRREHARLKVIAISGGSGGNIAWLPVAKELGAVRVLKKPFRKEALVQMIAEVLDGQEETPGYWLSFEPF